MKGYATFFLIAVMSLGLVFLLATRPRLPYDAPDAEPEVVELADGGDAGAADGGMLAKGDAAAAAADAGKPGEKPMRVTTLGWELAAAGAALAAPDAPKLATPLELAPETTLDAVADRLGKGSDPAGADVAILPLPSFIAAYDRLKALDPRVFAVVGFSRGREEMHAAPGALLKAPPGADAVKLVTGSESSTLLGLFTLDLLGVPPVRVTLVPASADAAKGAPFAAVVRGTADERRLAFSTADASRFVPIVAVASKKQLDDAEPKMRELAKAWLDGIERAGRDAGGVAGKLAKKDESLHFGVGVGGAPEQSALVERLGQVASVGIAAQRALMGSQAKGAFTIETLAQREWSLARSAGFTTSPAPAPLPFDDRIITAIAPVPPAPPTHETITDAGADAGAFAALPSGTTPLLAYRAGTDADAAAVAAQIGFLAGVFEHAAFRISAKGGDKAARTIAALARDRFDIPSSRLSTVTAEPPGAFANVELVSLP